MVDENTAAFTICDFSTLIKEMDSDGLLNDEDYELLSTAHNRLMSLMKLTGELL